MKIGFDAKRLFLNNTGLGNYSRTLVQNLKKHAPQHEYALFSPIINETYPNFNSGNYSIHTPNQKLNPFWRSWGIQQQLQSSSLDIYHGLSNELPIGIQKIKKLQSVVTIHDLIFKKLPQTYPIIDRNIYHWKVKKALQAADKIIAISESTKRDIIDYYGTPDSKIELIYQACHPIFYSPTLTEQSPSLRHVEHVEHQKALENGYILVVGGLGKRKNLDQVLKAQALLPKDLQIPILLVGKGKPSKTLGRQLEDVIENKLLYWRKDIDSMLNLKQLYQKATMVVYPSVYEGFGLPVVEALLCKTPIITATNSSLREAGGQAAWYADNVEQLQTTIQYILTSSEEVQKRIEEGYQYAFQKFHPQLVTQQLIELYQSIL